MKANKLMNDKMGSVKDLIVLEPAYENKEGLGRFYFSNRYSVFDYGKMPDQIKLKGNALAVMAAFNFEALEKRGIKTHYKGLVTPDGKIARFSDLKDKSNGLYLMQVGLALVYRPIEMKKSIDEKGNQEILYDYSFFDLHRGRINNYLLGLEIIFRNGLPLGSSVFKKINEAKEIEDHAKRENKLKEIYEKLGLSSEPKPGDMLPEPIIGYTTKLEAGDRNLSEDEAFVVSGLGQRNFSEIRHLALDVDNFITEQAKKTGFVHYDGKVEMLFNNRLVLCDAVGTFDENRFDFNNQQISKEVLRQWYDRNQPEFRKACENWKKTGERWQERCDVKPLRLPENLADLVSQMYMAGCNRYVERNIFNAPDLEDVMEKLRAWN